MSLFFRSSILLLSCLSIVACSSTPSESGRVRLTDESRGCCCNGYGINYAYQEADGTLTCDPGYDFREHAVCNEVGGPCFDHFPLPDGGRDGGDSGAIVETDSGLDSGGPTACDHPNTYSCSGGGGVECCSDGFLHEFVDGPCWTNLPDAGMPDCESDPFSIGCACATEDETHCRLYVASLICQGGTWNEWSGHTCC